MRLYFNLFKNKLITNISYRMSAIAGILTQFFFGFVFISVYVAFFESGNSDLDLHKIVSYIWLNQAFYGLTYIMLKDNDFVSMIKNGNIAYELCKPINFFKKWFSTFYGIRVANVLLKFLPIICIAMLLPYPYKLEAPVSIMGFALFVVSLIISSFLVTGIAYIFHILIFFTLDDRGIINIFQVLGEIFYGGSIPLYLFPGFLQTIAYALPFRYISDLPYNLYTGYFSINEGISLITCSIIWLVVIVIIGNILTKLALNKSVIQGG